MPVYEAIELSINSQSINHSWDCNPSITLAYPVVITDAGKSIISLICSLFSKLMVVIVEK